MKYPETVWRQIMLGKDGGLEPAVVILCYMNTNGTLSSSLLNKTGQITGAVAGALSCLLWMATLWDPASPFSFSPASFVVVFLMILVAIIAVIASIKGNSTMLLVLFVVAFLPIGLYVIAVPHWIRWVGLTNLGYLVAGLLLRLQASSADSAIKNK